ncbi:MAG: cupin domain-containing protein [Pirellulaceae bacterium]|nr:cupin domain-containing protein [Pirellulaceae bacterium]
MEKMIAHYRSLLDKEHGARKLHVHLTELDPAGDGWGRQHAHEAEEVIYILEGEAEFTFAGRTYRVGPGELVFFPSNVTHAETRFLTPKMKYLVIRTMEPNDARCCCGADLKTG